MNARGECVTRRDRDVTQFAREHHGLIWRRAALALGASRHLIRHRNPFCERRKEHFLAPGSQDGRDSSDPVDLDDGLVAGAAATTHDEGDGDHDTDGYSAHHSGVLGGLGGVFDCAEELLRLAL